jgi:hypothetical protein
MMFNVEKEKEMDDKRVPQRGTPGLRPLARSRVPLLVMIGLGVGVALAGTVPTSADQSADRNVTAHAAKTIWVHEEVHATNVSHQGNTVINDRGTGKGTFDCPTVMQVRIYYTTGSTKISCQTKAGTIEASGKVAFFSAGPTATFTGTIPITHGTGRYAHGSGKYRVEGRVVRKTYAVEASTKGWFTY